MQTSQKCPPLLHLLFLCFSSVLCSVLCTSRQEGVGLGEQPAPPTTTTPEHDHWKMYWLVCTILYCIMECGNLLVDIRVNLPPSHLSSDWTSRLSGDANSSFLRAAELGCSLGEAWLVCNAATYLWNYCRHWIEQNKFSNLVETFRPLLASIKQAQPHK